MRSDATHAVVGLTSLLALMIAGCTGATSAPAAKTESPTLSPTASFGEGFGSVTGLVVDNEMRPIAQAAVRLVATDGGEFTAEASSAEDGGFALKGLRPGAYTLVASKQGFYASVPKQVHVVSEEPVEAQILLQPLPVAAPHHTTKSYSRGIFVFGCVMHPHIGNVDPRVDPTLNGPACSVEASSAGNDSLPVKVDERLEGELTAFLVEVDWTPTVTACKVTFRSEVLSPQEVKNVTASGNYNGRRDASNPWYWSNLPNSTSAPTRMLAPRNGPNHDAMHSESRTRLNGGRPIVTDGDWRTRIDTMPLGSLGLPVDYSCVAQQAITIWISLFFVGPLPAPDWTATA